VTGLGSHRIGTLLPGLSDAQRAKLAESLGAGGARVGGEAGQAVREAFVYALNSGLRLAAAVAAVGALITWLLIADRPAPAPVAAEAGPEGAVAAPAGEAVRA
jgi:hypothetical protein